MGGIGAALKVTPGAMAALDGWRGIVNAIATLAFVGGLSAVVFGIGAWLDFFQAITNAEPSCGAGFTSIACLAAPALGMSAAKVLALGVAAALAVSAALIRDRVGGLGLVTTSLLAATAELDPYVHYWLYFAPLTLVVALRIRRFVVTL